MRLVYQIQVQRTGPRRSPGYKWSGRQRYSWFVCAGCMTKDVPSRGRAELARVVLVACRCGGSGIAEFVRGYLGSCQYHSCETKYATPTVFTCTSDYNLKFSSSRTLPTCHYSSLRPPPKGRMSPIKILDFSRCFPSQFLCNINALPFLVATIHPK